MKKLTKKQTLKPVKKKSVKKTVPDANELSPTSISFIRELNYRNNALQVINMIADKLHQSFDIQTIAREAVETIAVYTDSPLAVLYQFDEKNNILRFIYGRGFSDASLRAGTTLPMERSISSHAIKSKQVVNSFDLANDKDIPPDLKKALLDDGINVAICIPLLFQDKVLGVLNVLFRTHSRTDFEEQEKEIFLSVGKTVGLAMANAQHVAQIKEEIAERIRAEESLYQTNSSLMAINMISDAVYHSIDFDTVVAQAANAMDRYFKAPSVSIYIVNKKQHCLDLIHSSAAETEAANLTKRLPMEGSFTASTVNTKKIISSEDIAHDERVSPNVREAILNFGWQSCLSLPLLFQDDVFGAMNLFFREKRSFTQSERETFLSIGKTIGLAMANAKHVSQIKAEVIERKRAEEDVRVSEIKYRNIFSNTTEGIFQTTPEGLILTANPALARILGYDSPEDAIHSIKNLGIDFYVHPERRKEFLNLIGKQGFVRDFEYQVWRKDRQIIDVSMNSYIIRDKNNKLLFFEGTLRDITQLKRYQERMEELVRERTAELTQTNEKLQQEIPERKRAEEALRASENKYRNIFNNTSEGIFQTSPEGRILTANPALAQILAYDSAEDLIASIKNLGTDLFVHPERRKEFLDLLSKQGFVRNFEYQAYSKDRRIIDVAINVDIVRDENQNFRCFEGVLRDITELKKYQEHLEMLVLERTTELTKTNEALQQEVTDRKQAKEIRKLNEELEQRVMERTKELEYTNKEVEAFSYSLSHDLRTPLRAIDGFSRILTDEFLPQLPADAQRYLQNVRTNTQQMGKLLEDLLVFIRLSHRAVEKKPVDPAIIIRNVLEDLQYMQEGRHVEISMGNLPVCQSDPGLLRIVFFNLLSNALKFTRPRDVAVIEIGCRQEGGEQVYFIRDNGVGFNMQYAPKAFQVFQRLHLLDEFEGTGVGLAIVQRIISRHGGRIWVDAELNKGATFFFTLG